MEKFSLCFKPTTTEQQQQQQEEQCENHKEQSKWKYLSQIGFCQSGSRPNCATGGAVTVNPPSHLTSPYHNMADWFNNRWNGEVGVCEHWQLVTLVTTFSLAARFVFIFRTWRRRRRWWKAKHTVTVTTTTATVAAQCSGRQSDEHFTY